MSQETESVRAAELRRGDKLLLNGNMVSVEAVASRGPRTWIWYKLDKMRIYRVAAERIFKRIIVPTTPAPTKEIEMTLTLEDLKLETAERRICCEALQTAGNLTGAAELLGITRHALKRRIVKFGIEWPPARGERREP